MGELRLELLRLLVSHVTVSYTVQGGFHISNETSFKNNFF